MLLMLNYILELKMPIGRQKWSTVGTDNSSKPHRDIQKTSNLNSEDITNDSSHFSAFFSRKSIRSISAHILKYSKDSFFKDVKAIILFVHLIHEWHIGPSSTHTQSSNLISEHTPSIHVLLFYLHELKQCFYLTCIYIHNIHYCVGQNVALQKSLFSIIRKHVYSNHSINAQYELPH